MDKNIGYIYKITNQINNKSYIGQTRKYFKERWKQHKSVYKNKNDTQYNYPLYRAFRKYGVENFKFEVLEECSFEKLDEKEKYWILYYNSYNKGYNQDLGGKGKSSLLLNEKEVCDKYKKLETIAAVATYYNCSSSSIRNILNKNNIEITSAEEQAKKRADPIYMTNKKHEILKIFPSIIEAGRWVFQQKLTKGTAKTAYSCILSALHTGGIRYGYYWYSLKYSDKQNQEYKEKIKKRSKTDYQKSLRKNKHNYPKSLKNNKKICPICGNKMAQNSKLCINCNNSQRKEKSIKAKEEKGITREFLKQEIRTKPFTTIAKEQGVSDNTIRKWCKKYNLPYKSSEIKEYTDDEWKLI